MKAFKSIFAVLLSAALVFSFAACSDDDDDDEPSAVATFATEADKHGEFERVLFYGDNTFAMQEVSSEMTLTTATGTYTGDPNKASETIKLTVKKIIKAFVDDSDDMSLVDATDEILTKLKITNPLEATISADGKTVEIWYSTYIKQ